MVETMQHWRLDEVGRAHLRLAEAPPSLNFRDKLVIETGMGLDIPWPLTPGSDVAGSVVASGAEVRATR